MIWRARSGVGRRSSRTWIVIWSAPPSAARIAAATGSGYWVRRDWRSVATWSTLTPRRAGMRGNVTQKHPIRAAADDAATAAQEGRRTTRGTTSRAEARARTREPPPSSEGLAQFVGDRVRVR